MRITPHPQLSTHTVIAHDAETQKKDCALRITFYPPAQNICPQKVISQHTIIDDDFFIFFKQQ
jgi:hypothetical protein